jgi:hypothetical protein
MGTTLSIRGLISLFIVILTFFFGAEYSSLSSIEPIKSAGNVDGNELSIEHDEDAGSISVYKNNEETPILIQNVKENFRPYIHPIEAPDGLGELTQFSPSHHTHQTGLYWGFTRVNGRDFFHNPGEGYWRRVSADVKDAENQNIAWQTVYDMLDDDGQTVLSEAQNWSMQENDGEFILELEWQGEAKTDITIGKYDYGGLFLRMPWRSGMPAEAIYSVQDYNQQAEGKQAKWLDLGMQVDGRDDFAHIAIFDHPENEGFPNAWRVDGQMGVGPSITRNSDWTISKGQVEKICYRFKIYTGDINLVDLNAEWDEFAENIRCGANR